jgi:glycosyltransferase involved in cell wall biosynthesis
MSLKNKTLIVIANRFPTQNGSVKKGYNIHTWVEMMKSSFKKVIVLVPTPFFPKSALFLPVPSIYKELAQVKDYSYDTVSIYYPLFFTLPISRYRKKNSIYASLATQKCIAKNNLSGDLIHAHFTDVAGHVAKTVADKLKIPFFLTLREDHKWLLSQEKETRHTAVWSAAKKVIRVNNQDVQLIKKHNPHTVTIPNPFDSDLFHPRNTFVCRKKLGLSQEKKIFLHVGYYMISQKNQITLVHAMKKVVSLQPDALLYLIGGGSDKEKIHKEVVRLGLEKNVFLVGGVDHKKIAIWMNAADVFVLPSYSESFGIVLVEALACGLPCITTVNGGSEEVITQPYLGIVLSDPNSVNALASALVDSLKKKWDTKKIISYVKTNYSFSVIKKKYLEVYGDA